MIAAMTSGEQSNIISFLCRSAKKMKKINQTLIFFKMPKVKPLLKDTSKRPMPSARGPLQRSKLTFSNSRLLATFNCKMVAIKNSVAKEKPEGEDTL